MNYRVFFSLLVLTGTTIPYTQDQPLETDTWYTSYVKPLAQEDRIILGNVLYTLQHTSRASSKVCSTLARIEADTHKLKNLQTRNLACLTSEYDKEVREVLVRLAATTQWLSDKILPDYNHWVPILTTCNEYLQTKAHDNVAMALELIQVSGQMYVASCLMQIENELKGLGANYKTHLENQAALSTELAQACTHLFEKPTTQKTLDVLIKDFDTTVKTANELEITTEQSIELMLMTKQMTAEIERLAGDFFGAFFQEIVSHEENNTMPLVFGESGFIAQADRKHTIA